jgi:uncharacterized damage-inducible protein DinB
MMDSLQAGGLALQEMMKWLDRRFNYEPPAGEYPMIVERLRGTPARVSARILYRDAATLTRRRGDAWSAQEHIGHLLDLESLWAMRVEQFLSGTKELSAADMSNKKTYEAGHNERSIATIAAEFHVERERLVARLDAVTDKDVVHMAFHPRLKRSMRLIDLCFFVAEHDDHHLTIVTRLLAGHAARNE